METIENLKAHEETIFLNVPLKRSTKPLQMG